MYVDREPSAGPAGAGQAYTASRSLNIGRAAFCRLALSVSASRYIGMAEETDGVDAAAGSAGILPAVGPAGRPAGALGSWGAGEGSRQACRSAKSIFRVAQHFAPVLCTERSPLRSGCH